MVQKPVVGVIAIIILYYFLNEHVATLVDNPLSVETSSVQIDITYDNKTSPAKHLLYFANELALHPELINYSYANQLQIRKENFAQELESFTKIAKDLMAGNLDTFKHMSRYYAHPSIYHEYTRKYMINKWVNEHKNHVDPKDLIGSHPSCPKWDSNSNYNVVTYELSFTHNCCTKYGPPHRSTAKETAHFDHVLHYTYDNISEIFKSKNKDIVESKRGAGYWIWKPWVILNTMLNVGNTCDIICYCDSGTWWNNTAVSLFNLTTLIKYGIMVFSHSVSHWGETENSVDLTERFWSKRDAFLLLGVDIKDIYDTVIRKATFSCYQTNPDSIHFVSEWLYHSMDRRILTDDKGSFYMDDNYKFHENRHDQTIMSLLSKKWGVPAFMDASQYGYNDARKYGHKYVLNWDYPWIVKHTRGKS